jgi:deoxyribodipyrimidine photo-lyase
MGKSSKLVNAKRVRELKGGKVGDGPVLYWCSRDQRVADNWALIHACEAAAATGAPVAVVFSLVTKFLGAGARQFGFMLRGGEHRSTNNPSPHTYTHYVMC